MAPAKAKHGRQTDDGQRNPSVSLCFAGATTIHSLKYSNIFLPLNWKDDLRLLSTCIYRLTEYMTSYIFYYTYLFQILLYESHVLLKFTSVLKQSGFLSN